MRHLLHALTGAALLFSAGASAETLTFAATEGGGPVYAAMTAISKSAGTHEGLDMRVQPFRGTTQYVPIVNAGDLAGGLSNAMQLANAYSGTGTFEGRPNPNLRAIAASYPFRVTLGVKADKGIESVTQIKGLRMPTEYHTSRIAVTLNDAVLANAGLTRDDLVAVPVASFGESRKLMGQELVDLYLAVVGTGVEAALEQKIGKIRLLSFDDSPEAVAAMKKVIPVAEMDTVNPRPGLVGVDKPTKVMKYDFMLFTSTALSDDAAYKLAKTLHGNKDELAAAVPAFKGFKPEAMAPDIGVPYHPGAIRFYKEVGLWKNAD